VKKLYISEKFTKSKLNPRALYLQKNSSVPFLIVEYLFNPVSFPASRYRVISNPARSKFLPEMDFQDLIDTHYVTHKNILDNTKKKEAYFSLSASDILNLNYEVPIYVSYFRAFFFLSNIEQWLDEYSSVRCTLYKLN
jgi:hypothetical protein